MKKKILILNGPNLNLLGHREPHIYGSTPWQTFYNQLQLEYPDLEIHHFQSNHEGILIDTLQQAQGYTGIILNAGALSHYSYALYDAIRASTIPVVEVHISNIYQREAFRSHSVLSAACLGLISGFGLKSYQLALDFFLKYYS
ncbi:MAG: type II 3-dehydroquinate dehydratase [Bacteroidia bacterium]|nr:type II 3-dehydroquinate dehydratase [Bacteroidia bacterium]MDW8158138.1 type II 3-dehydroquinate dehydratase [Bacteroidia bacterium]